MSTPLRTLTLAAHDIAREIDPDLYAESVTIQFSNGRTLTVQLHHEPAGPENDTQRDILEALEGKTGLKVDDLAAAVGVSRQALYQAGLVRMRERGLLVFDHHGYHLPLTRLDCGGSSSDGA